MAAAALAIVVTQLFPFFGIPEMEEYHPIYQQGWYFLNHFFTLKPATTPACCGSLLLIIFLYRTSEKIPGRPSLLSRRPPS